MILCHEITGYSIEIEPEDRQCFILNGKPGVSITGSFEVITPEPKPIIVDLTGPYPDYFLHYQSKYDGKGDDKDYSEGSFAVEVEKEGDYTLCISNGEVSKGDGITRTVAFNFWALDSSQRDYEYAGLQAEMLALRQGLDFLKDHQSYMNQREDVHKDALDSINTKILCWTVLEAVILFGMAAWQIMYIRSFFETKRRL